jgi:hypothetical protein
MRRVQGGDREAFATLVERHKAPLLRLLTALSRDRDRAEEVAQDAFVRLFELSHRYRERGQFTPYLYRIAANLLRTEDRAPPPRILLKAFEERTYEAASRNGLPPGRVERPVVGGASALPFATAPRSCCGTGGLVLHRHRKGDELRRGTVKSASIAGRERLGGFSSYGMEVSDGPNDGGRLGARELRARNRLSISPRVLAKVAHSRRPRNRDCLAWAGPRSSGFSCPRLPPERPRSKAQRAFGSLRQ